MKILIFASVLCLALSHKVMAQEEYSQEMPAEGDHSLMIYDVPTQTFSTEELDSNDLLAPGHGGGGGHSGGGHPGGGHPGGGHPGGGHPGGGHPGGGHPGGGHPGGGHPGGGHPPGGPWHPYPGWHNGWGWDHNWHPGWWHVGIIFPVWIWIDVPTGYWQCTAFNSAMQPFSRTGPDQNQAAYGALYACGGANYQQFGCYIPQGYCQAR
jgi:hypothetical protein